MSAKAVSYKIGMIKPNETNLRVIYFREKLVAFIVLKQLKTSAVVVVGVCAMCGGAWLGCATPVL